MRKRLAVLFMALAAVFAVLGVTPASATVNYVHVNSSGHGLTLAGVSYRIKGATGYGEYGSPAAENTLAGKMRLNNLEAVEFFCSYHTLSDAESSCTMNRLDNYIATAEKDGRHVVLNLSEYGQSLMKAGQNACTTDWGPYLSFLANHVNSVNGRKYGTDQGLSLIEIWGEFPAPNYGGAACDTATATTFFHRTLGELRTDFPHTMLSGGGFSYVNDPNSGVPWKAVYADANNNLCAIEINSANDRDISYPQVVSYCNSLATPKPTFVSAWSSCNKPVQYNGDISDYTDQQLAANHAVEMINYGKKADTVGTDFWNMKTTSTAWPSGSCDIGDNSPVIESAVAANEG